MTTFASTYTGREIQRCEQCAHGYFLHECHDCDFVLAKEVPKIRKRPKMFVAEPPIKVCAVCQKPYTRKKKESYLEFKRRVVCSRRCSGRYRKRMHQA